MAGLVLKAVVLCMALVAVNPVHVSGRQVPFPGYGKPIPPNIVRVFVAKKIYTQARVRLPLSLGMALQQTLVWSWGNDCGDCGAGGGTQMAVG
jgi:hypothetical protein